jgi:hypothetical protein
MNWLINVLTEPLKQGVARVSRSAPQSDLLLERAGLGATR